MEVPTGSVHDPHARPRCEVRFRFYAELNDFLRPERRKRTFAHEISGTPSVKDTIEALGVPHTEIDVILVDGVSVGFDQMLRGGERVAVYPVFERFDISPILRLRPAPLRVTRFIADVHLGTLARYLRLLGFDTAWSNDLDDETIIDRALAQGRIILTRDLGILRNGRVSHGYWLRHTDPVLQMQELVRALHLCGSIKPFVRCMECNGEVQAIAREQAAPLVPLQVFLVYQDFKRCADCGRVYWAGSHQPRLERLVELARQSD